MIGAYETIFNYLLRKEYIMENSEKLEKFINDLRMFINHNLELGYISSDITIEQFRDEFLTSIEDNFIPILKQVEKYKSE